MIQDLTINILTVFAIAYSTGILWGISSLKCVCLCYHLQDKVAHFVIIMDVHFHGEFKKVSAFCYNINWIFAFTEIYQKILVCLLCILFFFCIR